MLGWFGKKDEKKGSKFRYVLALIVLGLFLPFMIIVFAFRLLFSNKKKL